MSAFGAVISLQNTIHHILHSCGLSLVSPSKEILQVAFDELQPWERILQRLDESSKSKSRKKVNALDGRIKDAIWKFEDLLESLLSHQISLQRGEGEIESTSKGKSMKKVDAVDGRMKQTLWNFEDLFESLLSHQIVIQSDEAEIERDVLLFSIDLQSLRDDVHSFIQTLKVMEKEYIYEVDNMPDDEYEDEDESACIISSSTSGAGYGGTNKSKMIGFSDQLDKIKRGLHLTTETNGNIPGYGLIGMAGVGKTRLAREIYEDPQIMTYFDFRVWITLGRVSSRRLIDQLEVTRSILAELNSGEECLIVLDDVWELTEELFSLLTSFLERKNNTAIRILLTARNEHAISYVRGIIPHTISQVVRFLNVEESKELLCQKVFGENIICPYQLDKAATKIANKCEGLPLTILTVAELLSKSHNRDDPEYWEDVAEERNSVFTDAYNKISKVLFPSYDYLDQRFKMPFLYMAVFPRDYDIPPSKIINMLKAEGWFLDPIRHLNYSEHAIMDCFNDLCTSYTLVLSKPHSSKYYSLQQFYPHD